jgi:hypothetical protein
MWLIDINETEDWPISNIKIEDGKRNIDDFIKDCKKLSIITKLELNDPKDFFVVLGDAININEQTLANTLTIYEDNDSMIQFCYHQDYANFYEPKINYFSTIINNTSEIILGKSCFFMIDKTSKKVIDLPLENILMLLANIHIFKTFQVRNGDLEEICFPNIKGHIDNLFKDYNKHSVYNLEFYIPKTNTDIDLSDLGINEVCIHKYNGLIILKIKEDNSIDNESIKKNNIDTNQIRGLYLDLEKKYLSKLFLRSKDSNKYLTLEQYEREYSKSNTGTND